MPAPSLTPLPAKTLTGAWHQRFVLGAFGAPKMRQRYGLQIRNRLPRARKPVVSRAAGNAWECGNKIGGSEAGKLLSKCHHRHSKPRIKFRNAENKACTCPHCGHDTVMKAITLLRHVSLYPSLLRFRTKGEIPALGWGEKAVKVDFRLLGYWWVIKSTSGLKLKDGSQMPVHVMHALSGQIVMGPRDIEAAKGTAHEEAWRESMVGAINARVGVEA